MARRKISFEPAASCEDLRGLMAMKVSLCGPHSLETSTFVPVDALTVAAENASGPFCEMYVNLSHQVGSCWVLPASAGEASASAARSVRVCMECLQEANELFTTTSKLEPDRIS